MGFRKIDESSCVVTAAMLSVNVQHGLNGSNHQTTISGAVPWLSNVAYSYRVKFDTEVGRWLEIRLPVTVPRPPKRQVGRGSVSTPDILVWKGRYSLDSQGFLLVPSL